MRNQFIKGHAAQLRHLLRHKAHIAGSFRLPRIGTGARYGLSVSISRRSGGTKRETS
jgi:hypothetical protein